MLGGEDRVRVVAFYSKAHLTKAALEFPSAACRERSAKRALASWPQVPRGMSEIESPHPGNDTEPNGSMAANVIPILIRNLAPRRSAAPSNIRSVTRMHKPRSIALNGDIETCPSRKADKEDIKAVRIAVCYLARGMQVFGMPSLLLLGMSSTAT